MNELVKYKNPDIVVWNNQLYDFAYYSATDGLGVVYIHNCRNMQDSFCVPLDKIKLASDSDKENLFFGI